MSRHVASLLASLAVVAAGCAADLTSGRTGAGAILKISLTVRGATPDRKSVVLDVGTGVPLQVTALDANGHIAPYTDRPTFMSRDSSIVSVTADGFARLVKPGNAHVVAVLISNGRSFVDSLFIIQHIPTSDRRSAPSVRDP